MLDHVREAYPLEGCGILLSDGKSGLIEEIKSIENAAAELSGLHFAMDPFKLYKIESEAEAEGKVIVGFYHSHPDRQAILSEKDKEYMIPQMLYIVVSTGREGQCIRQDLQFIVEFNAYRLKCLFGRMPFCL